MRNKFIIFLALGSLVPALFSQIIDNKAGIRGRVVDLQTGKPLSMVNVFLSNTTKGCATDENGRYFIRRIPLGRYELVASRVGYEVKSIHINIKNSENTVQNMKLIQTILEGERVTIKAKKLKHQKQYFEKFRKEFLGESKNASKCEILNSDDLIFYYDLKAQTLTASAVAPLRIENRRLGYSILYTLIDFQSDGKKIQYLGKAYFEELPPKNDKQKMEWRENRLKAYGGSFHHFLFALVHNRLSEEGFEVQQSEKQNFNIPVYNTLVEYEKGIVLSEKIKVNYHKEANPLRYINSFERKLGYLRGRPLWGKKFQTSYIQSQKPGAITVHVMGFLNDPLTVIQNGYWGWERFADRLPLDFVPSLNYENEN